MIVPAMHIKVAKFVSANGEKNDRPQPESSALLAMLDNGTVVQIATAANNREKNSLYDYLAFKLSQSIKTNEISKLMSHIVFSSDPFIEKWRAQLASKFQNPKDMAEYMSRKILENRFMIKRGAVVRIAAAIDNKGNIVSKCIYSKKDKNGILEYSTSGIYSAAVLKNHIPIEIYPVYKGRDFLGFFGIRVSRLANVRQILYLLEHAQRTVEAVFQGKLSGYYPITFFYTGEISDKVVFSLIKRLNFSAKNMKEMLKSGRVQEAANTASAYVNDLRNLSAILSKDPSPLKFLNIKLPINLDVKEAQVLFFSKKNPFYDFPNSVVTLNFSRENPNVKNAIKGYLQGIVTSIAQGVYPQSIIQGVYNMPPEILPGISERDRYGFMTNNIDQSKLVLSFNDSYAIIGGLYENIEAFRG